jgi:hypothetical protein
VWGNVSNHNGFDVKVGNFWTSLPITCIGRIIKSY